MSLADNKKITPSEAKRLLKDLREYEARGFKPDVKDEKASNLDKAIVEKNLNEELLLFQSKENKTPQDVVDIQEKIFEAANLGLSQSELNNYMTKLETYAGDGLPETFNSMRESSSKTARLYKKSELDELVYTAIPSVKKEGWFYDSVKNVDKIDDKETLKALSLVNHDVYMPYMQELDMFAQNIQTKNKQKINSYAEAEKAYALGLVFESDLEKAHESALEASKKSFVKKAGLTPSDDQTRLKVQVNGVKQQVDNAVRKIEIDKYLNKPKIIQITSDEEYLELESGTVFIDPEGKERTKP
jgi:hypothetical protein